MARSFCRPGSLFCQTARRTIQPADRQTKAYVHTKELQYQLKRKRGDYANVDFDDLTEALSSDMPFD